MISSISTLLSLTTAVVALLLAVLAVAASQEYRRVSLAYGASVSGVLGISVAAIGTARLLDLAAVVGVVLVGGVAGAGWAPRGRSVLLALGVLGFALMLYARFLAFSQLLGEGVALDQLTWGIARSSGFVAFLAATGAVVLGARRPSALPIGGLPARVYALHRALGVAAVAAMAVHLVALWTDDFVEFTPAQLLFLPWTSGYEPFAVTLGWLAMISLVLTAASGGLRRLLPGWRIVHALAYLTFALGLVHGLLAGSDSGSLWALGLYAAALILASWTLWRRLSRRPGARKHEGRTWTKKDFSPTPDTRTPTSAARAQLAGWPANHSAQTRATEETSRPERAG